MERRRSAAEMQRSFVLGCLPGITRHLTASKGKRNSNYPYWQKGALKLPASAPCLAVTEAIMSASACRRHRSGAAWNQMSRVCVEQLLKLPVKSTLFKNLLYQKSDSQNYQCAPERCEYCHCIHGRDLRIRLAAGLLAISNWAPGSSPLDRTAED